jgi:uncharacterized membrane protein YeaQ/YmgE (transglycosylase-associated protein family)
MGLIATIIIGFVVGLLARFLVPGRDPAGFIITTLLGVIGSLLATYSGQALNWYQAGETAGFFMSVIGAIVVLLIYHQFMRRPSTTVT